VTPQAVAQAAAGRRQAQVETRGGNAGSMVAENRGIVKEAGRHVAAGNPGRQE